jgi:hypothetical protein
MVPTMSGKADFTEQEWALVVEAPPLAGLIVVTAQSGGTFRESIAMAKAYGEAHKQSGQSQLLDELVATKPKVDRKGFRTPEELKPHGLERLREAVALLEGKGAPEEVADYRRFVLALAERVAAAHREDGVDVSPAEQAAIDEIASALGAT